MLNTTLQLALAAAHSPNTAFDLVAANGQHNFNSSMILGSGVGAGQADRVFSDRRTIAPSGTDDLDLAGALVDIFGATITFARIKVIAVAALAANANNVVIGAAAAAQFFGPYGANTHTENVRPGGLSLKVAPDATAWVVTATTADLLRIANSAGGTSVTYDIVLIGASA